MNRKNRKPSNKENIPDVQNQCANFDPRPSKDTVATDDIKMELSEDGSDSEMSGSHEDLENLYSTELQLYADHEIKSEIVIGPVVLQRPVINDWDYPNKVVSIKEENTSDKTQITKQVQVNLERLSDLQIKHYLENCVGLKAEKHDFKENNETEEINPIHDVQSPNDAQSIELNKCKILDDSKGPKPRRRKSKQRKNVKLRKNAKPRETPKQRNPYPSMKRKGKCPHCGKYFTSLGSHLLTNKYDCKTCDETFDNKCDYNQHITKHNAKVICDYCKQGFQLKRNLIVHIMQKHLGSKFKICLIEHLPKHKSTKKSNVTCHICEKSFTLKNNLYRHIKDVHNKGDTYSCGLCSRIYTRKEYLQEHENRAHRPKTARRTYECSMCDKIYYDASNRNRHFRVQHQGKSYSRTDTKAICICDYCKKSFQQKRTLIHHIMQNHMGNKFKKYHKCKLCKKQYTRISNLNIHMRKHKGEIRFICQLCGKRFDRRWYLQLHITKICSKRV